MKIDLTIKKIVSLILIASAIFTIIGCIIVYKTYPSYSKIEINSICIQSNKNEIQRNREEFKEDMKFYYDLIAQNIKDIRDKNANIENDIKHIIERLPKD